MDMEFEKVKDLIPLVEVNTTAAWEHVGLIEEKIRHLKAGLLPLNFLSLGSPL